MPALKPTLTTEVTPLPQAAHESEATTASVVPPPATPVVKKVSATWAIQRVPVSEQTKQWPAAFIDADDHVSAAVKPASAGETEKAESPVKVVAGSIVPAQLHQKVSRVCGGLAKDLKVIARPDHTLVIVVRPVNASVQRELLDRLLKLPEMNAPNVLLEMEMLP